ncbi:hypothetical protein [Rhodococcus sp. 4CII]|uniref:hypothetical protein n=1 Tax=Rhodococcus sp. 4CII TaxID=2834580 RepID=UPI00163B30C6|nr:hypothetical protein [Rhodococcus sp. 4CII]MBC2639143.1 hypothetical protein [Rhodococcus sp. 3A]MBC2896115.1 hypothetical protein [Rhodococcus sp. 4CII]
MSEVLDRTAIYIDGSWVESQGTGRIDVVNPATGRLRRPCAFLVAPATRKAHGCGAQLASH